MSDLLKVQIDSAVFAPLKSLLNNGVIQDRLNPNGDSSKPLIQKRKYFMSVEWEGVDEEAKAMLAAENNIFRTDVSSGDNEAPVFNDYKFNMGVIPDQEEVHGLTFKAYSIEGRNVEILGQTTILFEQMGDLYSKVQKSLSLHSLPSGKNGQTMMVARINVTLGLESGLNDPTLLEELQMNGENSLIQNKTTESDQYQYQWCIQIDLRAAVNIPLSQANESRMPSTSVEFSFSNSLQFDASSNYFDISEVIHETIHPVWNQQFVLAFKEGHDFPEKGSLWISIFDQHRAGGNKSCIERFHIPYSFFVSDISIPLEVSIQNDSKVYLTLSLQNDPNKVASGAKDLLQAQAALKQVNFAPFPVTPSNSYSCFFARSGLPIGSQVPYLKCNTMDQASFSRAFFEYKKRMSYDPQMLSKTLRYTDTHTASNNLGYLTLPENNDDFETMDFCLYIVAVSAQQTTPLTIVGCSQPFTEILRNLMYQETGCLNLNFPGLSEAEAQNLSKRMSLAPGAQKLCEGFKQALAKAEILFLPSQNTQLALKRKVQIEIEEQKEAPMEHQFDMQGNFDWSNDRERWQFLTKELGQKQELVAQTLRKVRDMEEMLQTKGTEMLQLRKGVRHAQEQNYIVSQQLAIERQIEVNQNLPKEIIQLSMQDLRTQLLSVATAYKSERVRNTEFEQKLKGALKQVERREEVAKQVENAQNKNSSKMNKVQALQAEANKEKLYMDTISRQEAVIAKLQRLLEESVVSRDKQYDVDQQLYKLGEEIKFLQTDMDHIAKAEFSKSMYLAGVNSNNKTQIQLEIERVKKSIAWKNDQLVKHQKEYQVKKERSKQFADWFEDKVATEFKLEREKTRVRTMMNELIQSRKAFQSDIDTLKNMISEKSKRLREVSGGAEESMISGIPPNNNLGISGDGLEDLIASGSQSQLPGVGNYGFGSD